MGSNFLFFSRTVTHPELHHRTHFLPTRRSSHLRREENAVPTSPDRYYSRTPPQPPGGRTMLALTDTASAALYGLQMARLSRVGDNHPHRQFIAPDTARSEEQTSELQDPINNTYDDFCLKKTHDTQIQ